MSRWRFVMSQLLSAGCDAPTARHNSQDLPYLARLLSGGWCCSTSCSQVQPQQRGFSTAANKQFGVLKKFYKKVSVVEVEELASYGIKLDDRTLRTPAQKPLIVPSFPAAAMIAAEWEMQGDDGIRPGTMATMTFASMAIDMPKPRDIVIKHLLPFVSTDVAGCRAPESVLAQRQAEAFDSLLQWAAVELGIDFPVTSSIIGPEASDEAIAAAKTALQQLDNWQLTAVELLAVCTKSLLLPLALVHGRIGIADAVRAARLEEDSQIEDWGLVEGGHDIDIADMKIRIAAPVLFLQLLG